jgi:hypothetical protein
MEMGSQLQAPVALSRDKQPPVPIGYNGGWALESERALRKTEKSLVHA